MVVVVGEARQLLFLLDRMRKCAAVKHAGERLGVFGLTELDQGRTPVLCFLLRQNAIPELYLLTRGSLLGSHTHDPASDRKLIWHLIAQYSAGSDSEEEMRPWADIPVHASLLSPRRRIHFCQFAVIVSNGAVVIELQTRRRRRSERRGSHSFKHVRVCQDLWLGVGRGLSFPLNQCEPVVLPMLAVIAYNPQVHYFDVICCLWGIETSRVIYSMDYIQHRPSGDFCITQAFFLLCTLSTLPSFDQRLRKNVFLGHLFLF